MSRGGNPLCSGPPLPLVQHSHPQTGPGRTSNRLSGGGGLTGTPRPESVWNLRNRPHTRVPRLRHRPPLAQGAGKDDVAGQKPATPRELCLESTVAVACRRRQPLLSSPPDALATTVGPTRGQGAVCCAGAAVRDPEPSATDTYSPHALTSHHQPGGRGCRSKST